MEVKPAMYDPKTVAQIMAVNPATIINYCKEDKIPHRKAGRQYRIPIDWVNEWVEGNVQI